MKNKRYAIKILIILILGIAYLFFIHITGIAIPCVFKSVTGWSCPGCGITTMLYSLSRLKIKGAFKANPFLFVTSPFLIFEIIYTFRLSLKAQKNPKWNEILLYIYIAALILWGILRNLFF